MDLLSKIYQPFKIRDKGKIVSAGS
jgi:hypothetical protein